MNEAHETVCPEVCLDKDRQKFMQIRDGFRDGRNRPERGVQHEPKPRRRVQRPAAPARPDLAPLPPYRQHARQEADAARGCEYRQQFRENPAPAAK